MGHYVNPVEFTYHSKRYGKSITIPYGYVSDGSTGGVDVYSRSWWVHDKLTDECRWDDGTICTNKQASYVIYDILREEGRWFRARTWFVATLLWGNYQEWRGKRLPIPLDEHLVHDD